MANQSINVDMNFGGLEEEFRRALQLVKADEALAYAGRAIRQRTARGEFLDGSSPDASSYSSTPFTMPAGGLPDHVLDMADAAQHGTSFYQRDGRLWVVIEGGYRWLRDALGEQNSRVDLYRSGKLLEAMQGRTAVKEDHVVLDYGYLDGSDAEATRIARYHNELGAGKSRTVRRFVGLTREETGEVVALIEKSFIEALGPS